MHYAMPSHWTSHCVYNRACANDRISTDTQQDGEIHGTPWFPVAESPSKVPTYEDSTYQKGFSLIDECLYRANLFLQSFTIRALLLSENEEKNVFHGFDNSTSHFLLQ